ncbi:unnamed protein product [Ectocarpus sp. 4 AP-2014]
MKFFVSTLSALIVCLVLMASTVAGGPAAALAAYGSCQTGCNVVAVACYAAGGATFGVVTGGAGVPIAIAGCNTALGTCMAACWGVTGAAALAPTP